jgi:hypothetical protein
VLVVVVVVVVVVMVMLSNGIVVQANRSDVGGRKEG